MKDQHPPVGESPTPSVSETGRAALTVLQHAARVMKDREARAQALAQRAVDELAAANERARALEERALKAEARAREAEKWLMRLHQSISETLNDWQADETRIPRRPSSAA